MKKVIVKESGIHNTGLYAAEPIKKGAVIIEYRGEKIAKEEGDRRADSGNDYILILDEQYDLDGTVNGNEARFANHSCNPNCLIKVKDGKAYIAAMKDIKEGEELSYDYEFDEEQEVTKCSCKSAACRGYINLDISPKPVPK